MPFETHMKIDKFWFPLFLYSAIIFGVSALPNVKTPQSDLYFDKVLHIVLYLPFGFLLARALKNAQVHASKKMLICAIVVFSLSYGLSDEFHQLFVEGRSATLGDAFADMIGGFLGGLIFLR